MKSLISAAFAPLSKQSHVKNINLPLLGEVQYLLKLSPKRRTVSLQVKSGQIVVNAPSYIHLSDIEQFVVGRASWLKSVLQKQAQLPSNKMTYKNGSALLYGGIWHDLLFNVGSDNSIVHDATTHTLTLIGPSQSLKNPSYIRRRLLAFFKQEAETLIAQRLNYWIERSGLTPTKLSFKFYKNRWGCCYQSGEVRFNPLLVSAPLEVIDCVVIHELCHLKHMNHSAKFWALNKKICGHCDETKNWLRHNHEALQLPTIKEQ
ncbi:SprT family zinc-dependent metalloprotease [Psychrosphaera sp. 1_MG-2023]|uniref:M48 family metallopeptidase n=1 Tax=Psychrosphaera sp. 1_MG-2023 TaxID=3062643 RepID=UPI0026E3BCED|nr:SprT family zinc-dependent metalloprotease [Psychrosphaera sp. 1_MG-2023]MDO6719021.1 SprT family zinc-dependent metalloprotease [Psychrosphaera sp. 1_MG-2023]